MGTDKIKNSENTYIVKNYVPMLEKKVESENSAFNNLQVSNENNLVEIKEINEEDIEVIRNANKEEKEEGFFENIFNKIKEFFKNLFSSKKITTNIDNVVNSNEEISNDNTVLKTDEMLKIEDYKELSKEDPKYTVNGKIDQDFKQGNTADCVLLASLYSLSRSEEGASIIQDAIKINYDEYGNTKSYDVYFRGLDKTYNVSVDEYKETERLRPQYQRGEVDRYFSTGDDDMLLMELAYQKAFDDISQAKKSSSIFSKTDALTSVDYEQFLYAFVGTEDINDKYWIENKYQQEQIEKNKPKIMEIFETQKEFKLEDVYMSDREIGGMTINSMNFNWENTYIIDKKLSDYENGKITITNKETGETEIFNVEFLAECFGDDLTLEQEKQIGINMYDIAIESDFVFLGNRSHEPINVTDIDGKMWSICKNHAYGVKEINQDYIILVNPHNSTEEIKISKEEYIKNYSVLSGFELFSANFAE